MNSSKKKNVFHMNEWINISSIMIKPDKPYRCIGTLLKEALLF